jgi:hypothetical protein
MPEEKSRPPEQELAPLPERESRPSSWGGSQLAPPAPVAGLAQELELARFVRGELDPRAFPHREHVRMAFEMLRRHSFVETALHYSQALRTMTEKIGKPEVFHQTLTIAFLSLIAERIHTGGAHDFDSFAASNPDLMDKSAVARCYPPERLALDAARRTFILPGPTR